MGIPEVSAVAVVAPDLAWRPLPPAVYTAWMSQPCCSSCMNGTFTSYAAVLMMPAGQAAQQRTTADGRAKWVFGTADEWHRSEITAGPYHACRLTTRGLPRSPHARRPRW